MRYVKQVIISLTLVVASLFLGFQSVMAVDPLGGACSLAPADSTFCQNKNQDSVKPVIDSSNSLLVRIARTIILITGAISVVMVIIGGFRYVISNGDSNGLQSAKNTILYALIGLIIAAVSQIIVGFVLSKFV